MFCLQATERVLVNRTLSLICIKLLENVVDSMKRVLSAPYTASHCFIMIGTKLLSFYSSRNASALSSCDLMLLTILTNTVHSQDRKLKHAGITSSLQVSVESSSCERNVDYSSEPNSVSLDCRYCYERLILIHVFFSVGIPKDSSRLSRFKRSASLIKRMYKYQPKVSCVLIWLYTVLFGV